MEKNKTNNKYAVTICRFNEDDEQEVLLDQYTTADGAIDLLLYVQQNVEEPSGEEEEETVEVEEPKPRSRRQGRRANYDKEAMIKDFRSGLTSAEVAEKHGVSVAVARNVQHRNRDSIKSTDSHAEDADDSETTGYVAARKAREEEEKESVEEEIARMAKGGLSLHELELMFPRVSADKVREIFFNV